jgi:hypothetical protein
MTPQRMMQIAVILMAANIAGLIWTLILLYMRQ